MKNKIAFEITPKKKKPVCYAIVLSIADLLFEINVDNIDDWQFLKDRYQSYVRQPNKGSKLAAKIYVKNSNLVNRYHINIKKNCYIFSVVPLKLRFKLFNDLLKNVFMYVVSDYKGLVLHASSLIKEQRSYVFIGKEGSGKSTIRKMFEELQCLGDDTAIIRMVNKRFYLYGSPFYQKTNRAYPNIKVPISGIYLLKQSRYDMVEKLRFPENIKTILSNVIYSGLNKGSEKEKLFNTASHMTQTENVFELYFQKSRSFWKLVEEAPSILRKKNDLEKLIMQINPQVKELMHNKISWKESIASWEILDKFKIIKEASWLFELGGEREVGKAVRRLRLVNVTSPHIELVNTIEAKLPNQYANKWLIVLRRNKKNYTIIDGNHTALAIYKKGLRLPLKKPIKLLIGEIDKTENLIWY